MKRIFIDINQYPQKVVDNTAHRVKEAFDSAQNQQDEEISVATPPPPRGEATEHVRLCSVLCYQGKTGESVITDLKKCLSS